MAEIPKEFPVVYYDTNVISYINAGTIPDFLKRFSEVGVKNVVSDTALEELPDGTATDLLSRHPFQ